MNKRIKELSEQAGFMEAWFSESGDDCEREIKKFAELIVRECMNICRECIVDGYDEAEEPRGRIKEHFGVEE